MSNTFGKSIRVTLFGESHGEVIGVVADGLAAGIAVSEKEIERQLSRRRPKIGIDTARVEPDPFRIVSGVFRGYTTGAPLCVLIENRSAQSRDYVYGPARPSHADYAASVRYRGFEDYRGGGHFSGRLTAALVALGGILLPALEKKGIFIGTHILKLGSASDRAFGDDIESDIISLIKSDFPVLDGAAEAAMKREIMAAREAKDSVGGITQTAIAGLSAGFGEPWFDSVEGVLSSALFSIGGIKGVEFGEGFGFADLRGSEANDPLRVRDGKVVTASNHNGGINGGLTNGMPIVLQCAVKPTPSIGLTQSTVDLRTGEETQVTVSGRHDPAIVSRICPVIDSVCAFAIADLMAQRSGTDFWIE